MPAGVNKKTLTTLGIIAAVTTVTAFVAPVENQRWINGLTVLAFWISAVSLYVAWTQIRHATSVAETATIATERAVSAINRHAAATDLARISERINRIRMMHISGQWERAHERYQEVRRFLYEISEKHDSLSDNDKQQLNTFVQGFGSIETKIGSALKTKTAPKLNDEDDSFLLEAEMFIQHLDSALGAGGL